MTIDTSNNGVMSIEEGSVLNAVLRSVPSEEYYDNDDDVNVVETHFPDMGCDMHMIIRIYKDIQGTQAERRTNLYLMVGEFDDTEEIKIQTDDLSDIESVIINGCLKGTVINGKAVSELKDLEPYNAISEISQKMERHSNCVMSAMALPVDIIAKYDTLLQTEFSK